MTPAQQARVDQVRAGLRDAVRLPCTCGECATVEQMQAALAMTDEQLLEVIES